MLSCYARGSANITPTRFLAEGEDHQWATVVLYRVSTVIWETGGKAPRGFTVGIWYPVESTLQRELISVVIISEEHQEVDNPSIERQRLLQGFLVQSPVSSWEDRTGAMEAYGNSCIPFSVPLAMMGLNRAWKGHTRSEGICMCIFNEVLSVWPLKSLGLP